MWDWFLREPIPSYIIEGNPRTIGGLSRKAPSNARGDDPFLGGFFFGFFRNALRGVLSKPRQDRVFRLFYQAEGRFFILRELAEFG